MLSVPNFAWRAGAFADLVPDPAALASTDGRFAAAGTDSDGIWLVRDKLGLNKLFVAFHEERGVVAANLLHTLVEDGAPFDAIMAVGAGTLARVDLSRQRVERHRYFAPLPSREATDRSAEVAVTDVRSALVEAMRQIRERVGPRVAVCLSGGLDSAVIAAYAQETFDEVTAYTYSYRASDGDFSDDRRAAERVAEHLGLTLTAVTADRDDVLDAVDDALRHGQDWRDFNVHCAIVNVLLARAIAASAVAPIGARPVVLTGDLMNEFVADYTPVVFRGHRYYELPELSFDRLRRVLVAGLQSGDREVGVFHAFGVDVLQPYAMCCEPLLRIPSDACERDGKRAIMERLAGDRLPTSLLAREKVRAQIGDELAVRGILPALIEAGRDARWLEERGAALLGTTVGALRRFLRGGIYRSVGSAARSLQTREDGYIRF